MVRSAGSDVCDDDLQPLACAKLSKTINAANVRQLPDTQDEERLRRGLMASIHDFKAIFFDDRIRQDFLGNFLELALRLIAIPAVEIEHEELSLAHVLHLRESEAGQRVLNRLTLRIKNRAFRHDPNVCFHARIIAFEAPAGIAACYETVSTCRARKERLFVFTDKRVIETHLHKCCALS